MKNTYESIQKKYETIRIKWQKIIPLLCIGIFIIVITQATKVHTKIHEQNYNTSLEQVLATSFYQDNNIQNGEVHIQLGTILQESESFQSYNNLVQYKEYVLPNQVFIADTDILPTLDQYKQTNDSADFLRTVAQTLLYTTTKKIVDNPQITLWAPPNEYFGIECFNVVWNTSPICNNYIDHFIHTHIFYNKDNYTEEFKNIIEQLIQKWNNKQKQTICQSLIDDIRYSQKDTYQRLVQQCSIDTQEQYEYIQTFAHAHTDIRLWLYQPTTYKYMDINIYKLISMLQDIYTNAQQNNINTRRVEWYILFMQQILRNHTGIDDLYKDLSYRVNTRILMPQLQNSNQTNILRALRTLHNWSDLLWFPGLEWQVSSWVILYDEQLYISGNQASLEERLAQNNFLKITRQDGIWSGLNIQATISIPSQISTVITLSVEMDLKLENNGIVIENITIQDNPEITQAIQRIQESTTVTIAQLYQFLSDNIDVYQTSTTTLCDQIQESLQQATVQSCDIEQTIINKKINDIRQIQYKISRNNNFQIENIQINDDTIQEKVNIVFSGVTTNNITLPLIINEIIQREDSWEQSNTRRENTITSTQIRSISNAFNEFLGTTPTDIVQIQSTIIVQFRLKGITFVTIYDEETKTLSPLFFNDTKIQWVPLKVANFSLTLSANNQNQQNTFAIDPLLYIKNINEPIYNLYIQLAQ